MAAGPVGPENPAYRLAYTYGLIPFDDLRTERWFLSEDETVELLASYEIPTNVLIKYNWVT